MVATPLDRLFAEQTKLLRAYAQGEADKQQALAAAEFERFDELQQAADRLFAEIVALGDQIGRLDAAPAAGGEPDERRRRLRALRAAAFAAAFEANQASQAAVRAVSQAIKQQLDRIRAGRRALAGYRGLPDRNAAAIITGKL